MSSGPPWSSVPGDWSVEAAERARASGALQESVVDYIRGGPWRNDGLADGIVLAERWWIGPVLVDTSLLVRVCGPEVGMPYRVSEESWLARTAEIAEGIRSDEFDLRTMPPLIVEYLDGEFIVADGNHRLGAFASEGVTEAWIVIWSNSPADHAEANEYLRV